MYIDKELQFSDAQALAATGASTNVIDLGSDANIGQGRPMYIVVSCDTALAGTSPTLDVALQTDDNEAFASAVDIVSGVQKTAMVQGDKIVLAVPNQNDRYLRINYTLGGTTPTVSVTSWLTDQAPEQWQAVADAI